MYMPTDGGILPSKETKVAVLAQLKFISLIISIPGSITGKGGATRKLDYHSSFW